MSQVGKLLITSFSGVSGRQQSTYTVTGLGGRSEDLEIIGNGTLVIWRVVLGDEGRYTCAASNDVGDSISKTVNLKINGKLHRGPRDNK